jgi:hypothetical protein
MIGGLFVGFFVLIMVVGIGMALAMHDAIRICAVCGKKMYPGEYVPHYLVCGLDKREGVKR